MKQAAILIGVLIFWGFTVGEGSTQEKPKTETREQSTPAAMIPSGEIRMGGIIIAIDPDRQKVLIQQYNVREERIITLNFDKEETGRISSLRKGDAVNAWVKGDTIIKIEKIPDSVWEEKRKEGK
jgi:hypothetical protein